jgi:hypothetical protein
MASSATGRIDLKYIQCHKCRKFGHYACDCLISDLEFKIREMQQQLSKMRINVQEIAHLAEEEVPVQDQDDDEEINICMVVFGTDEEEWFLDSGATSHITVNQNLLSDFGPSHVPSIRTTGSQIMPVAGKGSVKISDTTEKIKVVTDVLYVPGVHTNLFSMGKFTDLGYRVISTNENATF